MPYADLDNLIADYIPEATSDEENAALGRILDNVSAFVDSYCKRPTDYFKSSYEHAAEGTQPPEYTPETAIKRIRGEGYHFLRLPVHVFGSIESVSLNGREINSESYYESEKNGWIYFENDAFGLEDTFSLCSNNHFFDGVTYFVAAVWGYENIPLPIVEAVRLIVARIWSVQKGTIGQVTAEGYIQEKLIPQAGKDLLKPFIKREFEI